MTLPTAEQTAATMWDTFLKGDFAQASRLAKNLLCLAPKHSRARSIQAVFAWRNGDTQLGLQLARQACADNLYDIEALRVAARQFAEAGLYDESISYYRQARNLEPSFASEMDLALGLLAAGRWSEGWTAMECRIPAELRAFKFSSPWKMWDGRPDPRVLVLPEMGFGDMIQFARYNSMLPQGTCIWTRKALARLLDTMGIETYSASAGDTPPAHTSWAFSMSLPHILDSSIPSGAPYLGANILPADSLVRRAGRPAVGLVWGGSPLAPRDRLRSLSGAELGKLASYDKVDWHVLQQGPYQSSIRPWASESHIHTYEIKDFLHTAQLILALDAVVTVDTSVAHLAGALGKPCHVILSTVPDMRYQGLGSSTPWYDSLVLHRQTRPGDWTYPINSVLQALESI